MTRCSRMWRCVGVGRCQSWWVNQSDLCVCVCVCVSVCVCVYVCVRSFQINVSHIILCAPGAVSGVLRSPYPPSFWAWQISPWKVLCTRVANDRSRSPWDLGLARVPSRSKNGTDVSAWIPKRQTTPLLLLLLLPATWKTTTTTIAPPLWSKIEEKTTIIYPLPTERVSLALWARKEKNTE